MHSNAKNGTNLMEFITIVALQTSAATAAATVTAMLANCC